VVVGIYHAIATLCSIMPFSTYAFQRTIFLREIVLVISLWIQISPSFTEIVFDLASPMKELASLVPTLQIQTSQTTGFFMTLQTFGILRPSHVAFLISLFQDGMALFFASLFVFTPFPLFGVVIVAFLFPAFKSMRTLEVILEEDKWDNKLSRRLSKPASVSLVEPNPQTVAAIHHTPIKENSSSISRSISSWRKSFGSITSSSASKNKNESEKVKRLEAEMNTLRRERKGWIEYWICLSIILLLHIYSFAWWPSILMFTTLWLQHSYFKGSSRIIQSFHEFMCTLSHRNKKLREELETKKSVKATIPSISISEDAKTESNLEDHTNTNRSDDFGLGADEEHQEESPIKTKISKNLTSDKILSLDSEKNKSQSKTD
jgi:hypothetical protein